MQRLYFTCGTPDMWQNRTIIVIKPSCTPVSTNRTLPGALLAGLFAALISLHTWAAPPPPASAEPGVSHEAENAVVKIFSTVRTPNFLHPWTKNTPAEISGSGVVIEGKRILTNAHVVHYASQIQVQGNQAGDKLPAHVIAVASDIDLAVLKLDDESFFNTRPPLPRARDLPQIKDAVLAYGFPTGGTSLSITKGIVSRIEFVPYTFSVSGLRIQIDAAINPGNSGGPAVADGKMIGLAFLRAEGNTQNIGYIIPDEEIELFLKDIADGQYDGKPAMHDDLQTLENPALRPYLKLQTAQEGILVHSPYSTLSGYPLKEWDLISKIGETPIDDEGMIKLGSSLRVNFLYQVQRVAHGKEGATTVPLTIVRGGKTMQVEVPVSAKRSLLEPDLKGDYPPYFIYGPLVFSRVTQQFSQSVNGMSAALGMFHNPLVWGRLDAPSGEREDLAVITSPLFPHRLSKGYSNPTGSVIYAVNGTRVRSLAHLVALLRDLKDEFVTFELDQRGAEAMVFPRKDLVAATEEILMDNDVRAQGSPDMLKIWENKP
jgi:S1-C subfamily serine protease